MTANPAPTKPGPPPGPPFVDLPTVRDARGALTFMEGDRHVPFPIARVYLLYDIAPGQTRGHHAHHACRQMLLVLSGRLTVMLDDGRRVERVACSDPRKGLLIEPMVWHTLEDFAPGTVALLLASHRYDEADYIRDRAEFDRLAKGTR